MIYDPTCGCGGGWVGGGGLGVGCVCEGPLSSECRYAGKCFPECIPVSGLLRPRPLATPTPTYTPTPTPTPPQCRKETGTTPTYDDLGRENVITSRWSIVESELRQSVKGFPQATSEKAGI